MQFAIVDYKYLNFELIITNACFSVIHIFFNSCSHLLIFRTSTILVFNTTISKWHFVALFSYNIFHTIIIFVLCFLQLTLLLIVIPFLTRLKAFYLDGLIYISFIQNFNFYYDYLKLCQEKL